MRIGPAEVAHHQTNVLAREIEGLGYELDGPNRELFLKPPSLSGPPVIEMQFPVRPRAPSRTSEALA